MAIAFAVVVMTLPRPLRLDRDLQGVACGQTKRRAGRRRIRPDPEELREEDPTHERGKGGDRQQHVHGADAIACRRQDDRWGI